MPNEFWKVYNYLSLQWYEKEYGKLDHASRWYEPAMLLLESMFSGRIVTRRMKSLRDS